MARLFINPGIKKGHINRELQGHFSEHLGRCIYEGLYVGENSEIPNTNGMRNDVVEALKEMQIPVLRWPGGCFADEYHWQDGIGPKESRKKMINTHWGGVLEDNSFGTHEFMELCRQLGCKNYINGNVGSGTVREMSEWVEYMTFEGVSPMADLRKRNGHEERFPVDYFGVGNENWGCGGNMLPEYYGNEYRRYQTYVRNYNGAKPIYKIACGANADDYSWTEGVLKTCSHPGMMQGLSLHYYTVTHDWGHKGRATSFDEQEWYKLLRNTFKMETLITRHGAIMDRYDPEKKIGMIIDEWGTWYECEPGTNPGFLYQQNSLRDALVAGINLNIFNKHCDRVKMANIAQLVNVLQAVILTEGSKMVKTPTYHAFNMYKCHQDNELVESTVETEQIGIDDQILVPNLQESVSMDQNGRLHMTMTNLSLDTAYPVDAVLTAAGVKAVKGTVLTGAMDAYNSFDCPDRVAPVPFENFSITENGLTFNIPERSVLHLEIELK